ncbi:hypothetical protein [Cellulomonas sp. C5510]|uniref:hypothetical protein n=1 Tax=Cellulomonas sp. C5510 TaxID=2871170 RepID=UPI001C947FEC|nr:hypothetical protein [Cellulomonas sp. C5510]QZN85425.1 hypothetical protein K5O09_16940 [Cellulomonas sp. C5510]
MQILYVTDFVIEPAPAVNIDAAVETTLDALSAWVSAANSVLNASDLLNDGRRDLRATHGALRKYAEWTHLRSPLGNWVTRLDVVTIGRDGSHFTARVSVGLLNGSLRLRLGMAREVDAAGLSPVADPQVRQPHILADLVNHPSLRVSSGGQIVDGKFLQARGADAAALVADVLRVQHRLPVLLVHARTRQGHQSARRAAAGLVGLVRVVTVDLPTARHLLAHEPRARVPYAGGLLVWSDLDLPATVVGEEIVNAREVDTLRATTMRQVAPLSVLTRGSDELYRAVREAGRVSRSELAAARTAAAVESGNLTAIIEALNQERDQLRSDLNDAMEAWADSDARARGLASEAARWKATAEQLQIAQHYAGAALIDENTDASLDDTPALVTGDAETFDALASHLEKATEGRLVFTDAARTAWKKADRYPTPVDMRTALVKLAQVAWDLNDGTDRTIGHVDKWIRENYDLKVSLQDDKMPRSFRTFTFEGEKHDRTPHVKVNDGVPPHECGRIYFAFDPENGRIVVDHVGLHY